MYVGELCICTCVHTLLIYIRMYISMYALTDVMHTYVDVLSVVTITTPPENTTVCRGSDVIISCGHVIDMQRPVVWIINGTSVSQEQIFFSPFLYRQNRQGTPTENSLTVFSINGTTTFQCVVLSTPNTISTLGTVTVNGMCIVRIYM